MILNTAGNGTQPPAFTLSFAYSTGTTKVTLSWNPQEKSGDMKIGYALLRDGAAYSNPSTGESYNQHASLMAGLSGISVPTPLRDSQGNDLPNVDLLVTSSRLSDSLNAQQKQDLAIKGSSVKLAWNKYDTTKDLELLLIGAAKSYALHIRLQPEFFTGEQALFSMAGLAAYSYEEKALALMDSVFPSGSDKTLFRSIAADGKFFNLNVPWDAIENVMNSITSIGQYRSNLKRAMGEQFNYGYDKVFLSPEKTGASDPYVQVPYLNLGQDSFISLYGDQRSIYISAYLTFLYQDSKPVLSWIINEKLHNKNIKAYDYHEYEKLGDSDSTQSTALVKAALRYLTWGVEYTPFKGADLVRTGDASNEVYGPANLNITSWVTGITGDATRQNNYFPKADQIKKASWQRQAAARQDTNTKVHVISGDYEGTRLMVVDTTKNGKVDISRIDFFTALNLAWDTSVGFTPFLSVVDSTGRSVNEVPSSTLRGMNDQKMPIDTASGGKQNPYIVRNGPGNTILVGYQFTNNQIVGGIILVSGLGTNINNLDNQGAAKLRGPEFRGKKRLSVQYFDGTTWHDWTGAYQEYVYDYNDGSGAPPVGTFKDESGAPGWSLGYGNYFGNSNAGPRLSYVYIVPGEPKTCKGIRLVDKTGTVALDVAEFMVFGGNPVKYLTNAVLGRSTGVRMSAIAVVDTSTAGTWSGTGVTVDAPASRLLANGDPNSFYRLSSPTSDTWWIRLNKLPSNDYQSIVLWEHGFNGGGSSDLPYEPLILTTTSDLFSSTYFSRDIDTGAIAGALSSAETPFGNVTGNALPYASHGIDSPRTFAYKMDQQVQARKWYVGKKPGEQARFSAASRVTTLGEDDHGDLTYDHGYVDELDVARALGVKVTQKDAYHYTFVPTSFDMGSVKPFLPGRTVNTQSGFLTSDQDNSPFTIEKVAGVDALGMLGGAVSMSGVNRYYGALNVAVADELDKYYQMTNVNAPGLDSSGKPLFKSIGSNKSYLSGDYRLTRADIERSTVIVPDVSLMQPGDLLVKYDAYGEPQIGIVVGFAGSKPGTFGTDVTQFWKKVIVLTIRRGFQMVSLGYWGNPDGGFGGFAADPYNYTIRRLLVRRSGLPTQFGDQSTADSWEMVREIPTKMWDDYPTFTNSPVYISSKDYQVDPTDDSSSPTLSLADQIAHLKTGQFGGFATGLLPRHFYRELPPSSISTRVPHTLKRDPESGNDLPLLVNGLTGWREYPLGTLIQYHRGVDFQFSNERIYAPEGGVFYVLGPGVTVGARRTLSLPRFADSNGFIHVNDQLSERFERYSEDNYGYIGVLLTGEDGLDTSMRRLYLFCHLGPPLDSSDNSYNGPILEYDPANPVRVDANQWIATSGSRGIGTGPHLHVEVYEYFARDPNMSVTGGWEKVNALSVFDPALFDGVYGWWAKRDSTANQWTTQPVSAKIRLSSAAVSDWVSWIERSAFSDSEFDDVFRAWRR